MSALSQLELELRRAVAAGEFDVYYQPVVSLADGGLAAFESLARWRHPARGPLAASEFFAVAEQTRLIDEIGAWVLYESCRQLGEWRELLQSDAPPCVSVNVNARQLARPGFVERLRQTLSETNLPARCLKLEINERALTTNTETPTTDPDALTTNTDAFINALARLRALGVRLAIDDLGTDFHSSGAVFPSASPFRRLSFDALKIDRALTNRACACAREARALAGAVALASHVGASVVAKGVETDEQHARLAALGCTHAQGFLYSAPVAAEDALALIRRAARATRAPNFQTRPADRSLSRLTQVLVA